MGFDESSEPTGADIDAKESAVQRWQEANPLHETGVVSPVPRCDSRHAGRMRGGQKH